MLNKKIGLSNSREEQIVLTEWEVWFNRLWTWCYFFLLCLTLIYTLGSSKSWLYQLLYPLPLFYTDFILYSIQLRNLTLYLCFNKFAYFVSALMLIWRSISWDLFPPQCPGISADKIATEERHTRQNECKALFPKPN